MLTVTHEMGFARESADRIIFMDEGRFVEIGPPEQLFDDPLDPRTRTFLSAFTRLEGTIFLPARLASTGSGGYRPPGKPTCYPGAGLHRYQHPAQASAGGETSHSPTIMELAIRCSVISGYRRNRPSPAGWASFTCMGVPGIFPTRICSPGRSFAQLASQGHVIMDVAYTLAPKADLRGMVGDVKQAIAWLKDHASVYDVNPERLVLVGGSAGGHLALLAAYTPNHPGLPARGPCRPIPSVHAVVCYYGLSDMVETFHYLQPENGLYSPAVLDRLNQAMTRSEHHVKRARLLPEYSEWNGLETWMINLFGGTPDEVPDQYALGSPATHVCSDCPPTLLIQGAHDFGGMVDQIRHLNRALRQAGVLSLYLEIPETEHAFDLVLPQISPAAQTATYYTERFLALMI